MTNLVTLSNFAGYTNFTLDEKALKWTEESLQPFLLYVFVDNIFTITIISWVFFFKVYSGVLASKINQDKV